MPLISNPSRAVRTSVSTICRSEPPDSSEAAMHSTASPLDGLFADAARWSDFPKRRSRAMAESCRPTPTPMPEEPVRPRAEASSISLATSGCCPSPHFSLNTPLRPRCSMSWRGKLSVSSASAVHALTWSSNTRSADRWYSSRVVVAGVGVGVGAVMSFCCLQLSFDLQAAQLAEEVRGVTPASGTPRRRARCPLRMPPAG